MEGRGPPPNASCYGNKQKVAEIVARIAAAFGQTMHGLAIQTLLENIAASSDMSALTFHQVCEAVASWDFTAAARLCQCSDLPAYIDRVNAMRRARRAPKFAVEHFDSPAHYCEDDFRNGVYDTDSVDTHDNPDLVDCVLEHFTGDDTGGFGCAHYSIADTGPDCVHPTQAVQFTICDIDDYDDAARLIQSAWRRRLHGLTRVHRFKGGQDEFDKEPPDKDELDDSVIRMEQVQVHPGKERDKEPPERMTLTRKPNFS